MTSFGCRHSLGTRHDQELVITGAGRGFGKEFAKAALSRGDKVAATARNTDALGDLVAVHGDAILPLTLDVTDRGEVSAAVAQARKTFGLP
jgi:NADP-dependent 3-hydroxy acid dehydrogenase YdfG